MRASKTRDHLLEVASDLFYTQGINKTGINDVIRHADVARMSLYNHFASKDELVMAVLEKRSDERQLRWREVEGRSQDPSAQLLAIFDVLEEIMREPNYRGCAFVNATIEQAQVAAVRERSVRHKESTRSYLQTLAERAKLENAESLSWQLMTLMDGAISTVVVHHDPSLIRHAQTAARALIAQHRRNHV